MTPYQIARQICTTNPNRRTLKAERKRSYFQASYNYADQLARVGKRARNLQALRQTIDFKGA